jgi:hypothetical protein
MLSKHATSYILLFVYGLIAGIGPSWHRHGTCCSCSVACSNLDLPAPKVTSNHQNSTSDQEHARNCLFCKHRTACESQSDDNCDSQEHQSEPCGDDCVVCDFYGKSYLTAPPIDAPELSQSLFLFAEPTVLAPSIHHAPSRARGPPSDSVTAH